MFKFSSSSMKGSSLAVSAFLICISLQASFASTEEEPVTDDIKTHIDHIWSTNSVELLQEEIDVRIYTLVLALSLSQFVHMHMRFDRAIGTKQREMEIYNGLVELNVACPNQDQNIQDACKASYKNYVEMDGYEPLLRFRKGGFFYNMRRFDHVGVSIEPKLTSLYKGKEAKEIKCGKRYLFPSVSVEHGVRVKFYCRYGDLVKDAVQRSRQYLNKPAYQTKKKPRKKSKKSEAEQKVSEASMFRIKAALMDSVWVRTAKIKKYVKSFKNPEKQMKAVNQTINYGMYYNKMRQPINYALLGGALAAVGGGIYYKFFDEQEPLTSEPVQDQDGDQTSAIPGPPLESAALGDSDGGLSGWVIAIIVVPIVLIAIAVLVAVVGYMKPEWLYGPSIPAGGGKIGDVKGANGNQAQKQKEKSSSSASSKKSSGSKKSSSSSSDGTTN